MTLAVAEALTPSKPNQPPPPRHPKKEEENYKREGAMWVIYTPPRRGYWTDVCSYEAPSNRYATNYNTNTHVYGFLDERTTEDTYIPRAECLIAGWDTRPQCPDGDTLSYSVPRDTVPQGWGSCLPSTLGDAFSAWAIYGISIIFSIRYFVPKHTFRWIIIVSTK